LKKSKPFGVIFYIVIVALLLWMVLGIFDIGGNDLTESQIVEHFRNEEVKSFEVKDGRITLEFPEDYE
jgi:hypothetical protein